MQDFISPTLFTVFGLLAAHLWLKEKGYWSLFPAFVIVVMIFGVWYIFLTSGGEK